MSFRAHLSRFWWSVLTLAVVASPAAAQSDPKWDVDVHIGSLRSPDTISGSSQLPAPGTSFVVSGNPPAPLSSRVVPSWYFGDGAALFNQSSAFVNASGITSLDPVLTTFGATRKQGQDYGIRFTRRIGSRYGVEIGVDSSDTPLTFSDTTAALLEKSRATFVTGWNSLIAAEQARINSPVAITNVNVSSILDTKLKAGRQFNVTVAGKVHVLTHGIVNPYVVAGGGVMVSLASEVSADLTGHYEFATFGSPKNETDNFSVEYSEDPLSSVFVFGGGVDGSLGRRAGWRVDVRGISRKNSTATVISTFANRQPTPPPANVFAFFTNPAIQFSTNPNVPSSLGGFLNDTETFTGSGRIIQTSLTAGVFLRF